MQPFFFLSYSRQDERALDRASRVATSVLARHPSLRSIPRTAGGDLLADPKETFSLESSWGTLHVLGRVHPAGMLERLRDTPGLEHPGGVASWLTRSVWGTYVAVLEGEDEVLVLRDPSGAASLHVVTGDRLTVAGSAFDRRLATLAGAAAIPDLAAVAQVLARPPSAAHLALLDGVTPVAPGETVSLATGRRTAIWSPAVVVAQARPLTPTELLATLDATVAALAPAGRIGVELSGGFDSSTVFASLMASGRDCVPFNVATAAGGGDERRFARSMAMRWGVPLAQYEAGGQLPDYRPFAGAQDAVQPVLQGLDSVFAGARDAMIDEQGVEAVMTGQGGDSLFFRLPTRLVAADRLRAVGLGALSPARLVDDAVRVQGSIWSVLATAFGMRLPDDRRTLPALVPHLMGEEGQRLIAKPAVRHPWLEDADALPPAKHRHLMMLVHAQLFHGERVFAPSVPLVHPLLAQPLVERLLACPAHVLAKGPLDRGLARAAMHGRLSRDVAERRSKGEASDHYARAALHNLPWLRELLLDGMLVSTGLLDRDAIDRALNEEAIHLDDDYRGFVVFAALECWLCHWRDRSARPD